MPEITARKIVEDVLTPNMTREVWTASYAEVLPFALQDFSVGALLPAVLYMFRWGHRRGLGAFESTFGAGGQRPTVNDVARRLADDKEQFDGFDEPIGKVVLSDLLLCYCLENIRHETGREKQVQRVFPTHYMASWIDLPKLVVHLRNVPEMLVALLANQKKGPAVTGDATERSFFPVASNFADNLLLRIFGPGVSIRDKETDLSGDRFDEEALVGIDQLIAIRMAEACGHAPQMLKRTTRHFASIGGGTPEIPNKRPISTVASREFNEDLRVFLAAYGLSIPRQSLLPMLESCISINLTNVFLSAAGMCLAWDRTGTLPGNCEQESWPLFVDCSCSVDNTLRRLAEESMEDCVRRLRRTPVVLMSMRLAAYLVRHDRKLKKEHLPPTGPDAREWIDFLGDIVQGRHRMADRILDNLDEKCDALAELLAEAAIDPSVVSVLKNEDTNPAQRLAEAITLLMGDKLNGQQVLKCLDSSLMVNEHNGLAHKRRVRFRSTSGYHKSGDMRSIVVSNTMLDFLVHRHLAHGVKAGRTTRTRGLSFNGFLELLRGHYGLYVHRSPPGMSISADYLLGNRMMLERRLRDLGLLVGVNDAESMKRLQSRLTNVEKVDNV